MSGEAAAKPVALREVLGPAVVITSPADGFAVTYDLFLNVFLTFCYLLSNFEKPVIGCTEADFCN